MRRFVWAAVAAGMTAGLVARIAVSVASTAPAGGGAVYTSNVDGDSVSALYQTTLGRIRSDIGVTDSPRAVSVSADGKRVYTGNNGSGIAVGPVADGTLPAIITPAATVSVIDGGNNMLLQNVTLANNDTLTDIALSPDGTKVWAALSGSGSVIGMDTATFALSGPYPVPTSTGGPSDPVAIDVSADGASVFVLESNYSTVEKLSTTGGASQGRATIASDAVELKVSADGDTLIVVGNSAAQFFSTDTLAPVATASTTDLGSQIDVAVAGGKAYVLNTDLIGGNVGVQATKLSGPKGAINGSGPSIDVYDAATGVYQNSFLLGNGTGVLGITVLSDGSEAFVSRAGAENAGSVTAVDLTTGAVGNTGSTGANPRRVAVDEIGPTTEIQSFLLPRTMSVKIPVPKSDERKAPAFPKDTLAATGFYDDGGAAVDYSQPVTITVGGYTRTITVAPNKSKTQYKFKDGTLNFTLKPNVRKSSLGLFTMKVTKTALGALIDLSQPVTCEFQASGMQNAQGKFTVTKGKYTLGHKHGDLFLPEFFPAHLIAKLGGRNKDSLYFKGGFASLGTAPATLGTVRLGFGAQFARSISGNLFKKVANQDTWNFKSSIGKSKIAVTIDFLREIVKVTASNVELGALQGSTLDVVFDAGNGLGVFRNTVRLSVAKGKTVTTRNY